MCVVLALFVVAASCAPSPRDPTGSDALGAAPASDPGAPGPSEACTLDADCVMTDFAGCCACCSCVIPYAMRGDVLAQGQARCAEVECSFAGCDEECMACPLAPLGRARCEDGRCQPVVE